MNYLSLTHLWRIPGLLLLLCARHLQLRQWFAWCDIFTLLCFLLHLLRRKALIYFSAGLIQPKQVSLLLLAFRQWNLLRRSFGLSRATDESGLPMTWLVPCFVPLLLAAERSVGRYLSKNHCWFSLRQRPVEFTPDLPRKRCPNLPICTTSVAPKASKSAATWWLVPNLKNMPLAMICPLAMKCQINNHKSQIFPNTKLNLFLENWWPPTTSQLHFFALHNPPLL